jgi:hypothetical protein
MQSLGLTNELVLRRSYPLLGCEILHAHMTVAVAGVIVISDDNRVLAIIVDRGGQGSGDVEVEKELAPFIDDLARITAYYGFGFHGGEGN